MVKKKLNTDTDTGKVQRECAKLLGLPEDTDQNEIMCEVVNDWVASKTKSLSQEPTSDVLVKLVAENRTNKIIGLVKAGVISPSIQKVIEEKYTASEPLALTLANGSDDGFDFLAKILTENKIIPLEEKSGQQLLELANVRSQDEPNCVSRDIDKRREIAGQKI